MDYKYWCQFLSPDEFKNWEVEILMFLSSDRGRNDFFEIDFDNWKEFINASFNWSRTKQGSQYWMDIFQRDNDF